MALRNSLVQFHNRPVLGRIFEDVLEDYKDPNAASIFSLGLQDQFVELVRYWDNKWIKNGVVVGDADQAAKDLDRLMGKLYGKDYLTAKNTLFNLSHKNTVEFRPLRMQENAQEAVEQAVFFYSFFGHAAKSPPITPVLHTEKSFREGIAKENGAKDFLAMIGELTLPSIVYEHWAKSYTVK